MNDPIFAKSEFRLCDVPVPKGYPQSQTHAGICVYKGQYFLTCSPYPARPYPKIYNYFHGALRRLRLASLLNQKNPDRFENPLLYIGNIEKECPPVSFKLQYPSPLMDTPEQKENIHSFNSDPDIFIEDDKVYILNRSYFRVNNKESSTRRYVQIHLIEGLIKENKFDYKGNTLFIEAEKDIISPSMIKFNDKYLLAFLETNSAIDGKSFSGIYLSQSNSIAGLNDLSISKKIHLDAGNFLPWHMSLFQYKNCLYTIIACVRKGDTSHIYQMLGKFNEDLTALKIFNRPLTDYNSYRGSACVLDDGRFILYTTTLDKVKGSYSVDGRDILVASRSFEQILKDLC